MELARASTEHTIDIFGWIGIVLEDVYFENEGAIIQLTNVTLPFKTLTIFLPLGEDHPFAIEIERATSEQVNRLFNIQTLQCSITNPSAASHPSA
jgi:hypothetical protein